MSSEKVALGALSPGGAPRLATPLVLVFNSSDEWMAAALSELQSVPSRRHLGRVSARGVLSVSLLQLQIQQEFRTKHFCSVPVFA